MGKNKLEKVEQKQESVITMSARENDIVYEIEFEASSVDNDDVDNLEDKSKISEEEKNERQQSYDLPPLLSIAYCCILNDAAEKLIMSANSSEFPRQKDYNENGIEEELMNSGGEIFDRSTLQTIEDLEDTQKLTKYQNDVSFVIKTLKETCDSLLHRNTFDCLVNVISWHKRKNDRQKVMLEDMEKLKEKAAQIKKNIEKEKQLTADDVQRLRKETAAVKDDMENAAIMNNVTLRYLTKWENSRKELNDRALRNEEQNYENIISRSKNEMHKELTVNNEVENFIAEQQKDYEEALQEWMDRYDTEMEQLDLDIASTNDRIEEQELMNAQLKKMFNERQRFITNWLNYKEKKRLEKERLGKITEASIKIQCWWRSVMIRKRLGPFGKKKRGKGKGKGK